jgi:ketosteroid isomerase-like protein
MSSFSGPGGRLGGIAVCAWAGAAVLLWGRVTPVRSAPQPDTTRAVAGPQSQLMTREKFAEYIRRFNRRDEGYADLYADDVVFEHGPYYGTLRGRQGILDFYRQTWKSFAQTLVPGDVVIDNERGLMAVEITTHLVARVDGVASQSRPQGMKAGDEIVSMGVVFYEIHGGLIKHIRGAAQRADFHPVGSRTMPAPLPSSMESLTPQVQAQVEAAYRRYVECFNAHDVACFSNFYDDDVVFMAAPLPGMIGREAIVGFYQGAWKHLREHLEVQSVAFEHGRLVASLRNTIEVFEDYPQFPVRALKKGERFTREGTLTYELHRGRFVRISEGDR